MPEAALTAVPLTTYFEGQLYPTFSPDGSQVAFSWNGEKEDNFDIYVKLIGSEPPLRLTTNPADEDSPAWSPDGRWIAFCRDLPGGRYAVVLTSPIPGPERILTESYRSKNDVEGPFLAWSPDSHWLVLAGSDEPGEAMALFLFSVETGEKSRLTSPPGGSWGDSCPAFSPDGRTLAFFRWAAYFNSDLFLLELSPDFRPIAEPKRLTFGSWRAASPAWTADGSSLIFSARSGAECSLWRVNVVGASKPQRLATMGGYLVYPAISRRGSRLAYAQATFNTISGVSRSQLQGGRPNRQRSSLPEHAMKVGLNSPQTARKSRSYQTVPGAWKSGFAMRMARIPSSSLPWAGRPSTAYPAGLRTVVV
jgi:Tol biopolymer transport system component